MPTEVDGANHFVHSLACLLACFHLIEHILQVFPLCWIAALPAGAP